MCVHTQVTPLNTTAGTECVRLIFLQTWALREQGISNAWIEASEGAVHKGSSRAVPSTPEQESHHQGMGSTNFCSIPAKEFLHHAIKRAQIHPTNTPQLLQGCPGRAFGRPSSSTAQRSPPRPRAARQRPGAFPPQPPRAGPDLAALPAARTHTAPLRKPLRTASAAR